MSTKRIQGDESTGQFQLLQHLNQANHQEFCMKRPQVAEGDPISTGFIFQNLYYGAKSPRFSSKQEKSFTEGSFEAPNTTALLETHSFNVGLCCHFPLSISQDIGNVPEI